MNFSRALKHLPDKYVLKTFPDRGIRVTGADLRRCSAFYAAWLQSRNYKIIGIHMGNCPEFFYLFAGALRAGVKVRLCNALREAPGDIPIFDRESAARIASEFQSGCGSFQEYDWMDDEPFIQMTTSGTSGTPKIVEKSIRNYFRTSKALAKCRLFIHILRAKAYNCSPWYRNTGLFFLIMPLCGFRLTEITTEKFNPNAMRLYIRELRPDYLITTPSMLTRCVMSGDMRLPSFIIFTGETLSTEMIARFESCGSGQVLLGSYGTTEVGGLAHLLYTFDSVRLSGRLLAGVLQLSGFAKRKFDKNTLEPHCVGSIAKNADVKILNDGKEAEDGTVGEIWARTAVMLREIGDRYYCIGDYGYKRGSLLYYCGRTLNVINRSGEKIVASEIEQGLSRFEGVCAVTVFGVPSATHGEDICAVIESKNAAPVVDGAMLSEVLPKHMLPQHILFMDAFPLNAVGKTDISAIRQYAIREIGASSASADKAL